MADSVEKFLAALDASLSGGTFIKLTLGNYNGTEFQLQRILGRRITTTNGDRLSLIYRFKTRDITKNIPINEASDTIRGFLSDGFRSGHLFTGEKDFQLQVKKDGRSMMSSSRATSAAAVVPSMEHNRQKKSFIDPSAPYLSALGITDSNGRVLDRQRDKWRQINKYIEILESLIDKSTIAEKSELAIVDMGSGKGYLTFAAYDYLNHVRKVRATVTGVEMRQDLVELCNQISRDNNFVGLSFIPGTIAESQIASPDILIALHACDTATDDAIYKGIKARAQLIITAPCCHQELRPQISPPPVLKGVLKHGILLEHEAETITDGLRAMLLEANGYSAKVFEFVGVEHTPKNNMIVGTWGKGLADKEAAETRIQELMDFYGVRNQHLKELLAAEPVGRPSKP